MNIEAIIVAGGSGERFKDSLQPNSDQNKTANKLLYKISGVPLLTLTIRAVAKAQSINRIFLVTDLPEPDIHQIQNDNSHIELIIVKGGATRQASVYNGLKALPQNTDIVVIHDAARPFITTELIDQSVEAAHEHGAAIVATPVTDTIKSVAKGFIQGTIDRTSLWAAQTPQTFKYNLILEAHQQAEKRQTIFTDDAMILENFGQPVKIIEGDAKNIKITYYSDILLAESLLNL